VADEVRALNPAVNVELQPSSGGVFEVTADERLIFSKKALGRFPHPGEVAELIGR